MPIRFECDQCGQRLSIARRKAGTEIDCPTCGQIQRVPGEPPADNEPRKQEQDIYQDERGVAVGEVANAEDVENELTDSEGAVEADQQPFVFVPTSFEPPPIPDEVDLSRTIDLDLNESAEAPCVSAAMAPPPLPMPPEAVQSSIPSMPRPAVPWAICGQAVLLLVVIVGAFSAGYYLGHQDGSMVRGEPSEEVVAAALPDDGFADEEVLLEGRILWTPSPGKSSGDASASFIALPQDRIPQDSLPIVGLQPGRENNADTRASMDAIRAFGGVFARAESDGILAAVLPREGRYYLLIISSHAARPQDKGILSEDLVKMKQYFAEPEMLIGQNKYVWLEAEMRVGIPAVEHDFGLDGL